MERKVHGQRGGGWGKGSRKVGASVYFLELTPDVQRQGVGNVRHSNHYGAQYHLSGRSESTDNPAGCHDPIGGVNQSLGCGRRDHLSSSSSCSSSSSTRRHLRCQKHATTACDPAIMPSKDSIIILESHTSSGVPMVYRLPEVRAANPDRLNLDLRRLTMVPIFEGEGRLRMLNLQHNSITSMQNLSSLLRLVFLDLYDNLLHEINGLDRLTSLRVLMLGRNRIRRISGLQTLTKLDVLDLHENQITVIEGLYNLVHLRILNMAGNNITHVSGVVQLQSLEEVNISRNRVTNVYEVDELPKLTRLFLSNNHIQSFSDATSILHCEHIKELTLDGNPLACAASYRQSFIFQVNTILNLDQIEITDKEWHEVKERVHKEEQQKEERKKQELLQEHKAVTIANIRKNWEDTHHLMPCTVSSIRSPNMVSAGDDPSSSSNLAVREEQVSDCSISLPQKLQEATLPFFLDGADEVLHLYGREALEEVEEGGLVLSKQLIRHIHFHCIEFEDIARWLPSLLLKCPKVSDLSFDCTNLSGLEQLNALAQITSPLRTLLITPRGNPVTTHPLFTSYTIYRLHHLNLSLLNGVSLEDETVEEAEQMFGELTQQTTRLPKARLLSLISKCISQPTKRLLNSTPIKSSNEPEPLNHIGLHLFSTTLQPPCVVQKDRATSARIFTSDLLDSTLFRHSKVKTFEVLWPKVMGRLVQAAMEEYMDMDRHMKDMLADF